MRCKLSARGEGSLPRWEALLHHGGAHGVLRHVGPQGKWLKSQPHKPGHACHIAHQAEEERYKHIFLNALQHIVN